MQLKPLSLQHVARLWRPTPSAVCHQIIKLIDGKPPFSYQPLYQLAFQQARYGDSLEQLLACLSREKREWVLKDFRAILTLFANELSSRGVTNTHEVSEQFYNAGHGMLIPFRPPMVLVENGCGTLPWLIFWKSNCYDSKQLSLFVTLARSQMDETPDLENCELELWDFKAPKKGMPRELHIRNADEVSLLPQAEVASMLDVFIEGYQLAAQELKRREEVKAARKHEISLPPASEQPDLFDPIK